MAGILYLVKRIYEEKQPSKKKVDKNNKNKNK